MKNLLTSLICCFILSLANGQYVTIPDDNFVLFLQDNYPDCMDGNLMDTTCAAIVNENGVNCSNKGIVDFTGIQYFDNVLLVNASDNEIEILPEFPQPWAINLQLNGNNLAEIDQLPVNLWTLNVSDNLGLTSLPVLPLSVEIFACNNCSLLELPYFHMGMENISLENCGIQTLPDLPDGLLNLLIGNNPMIGIPDGSLPNSIEVLNMQDCELEELPLLPSSLNQLTIWNNNLTSLENLPEGIEAVFADNNPAITLIENLPNSLSVLIVRDCSIEVIETLPPNMIWLAADNNYLTWIPDWPSNMQIIQLDNNNIFEVPVLPSSVSIFKMLNNNVSCWPIFPADLSTIVLQGNPFTCLPNYVTAMSDWPELSNLPICDYTDPENNPFGCVGARGVEGHIFNDFDEDCSYGGIETGVSNVSIRLLDSNENQLQMTGTGNNGRYSILADDGDYIVRVDTLNKPFTYSCEVPGIETDVTIEEPDTLVQNIDFGLICKPGFDVGTLNVHTDDWIFPGQLHDLHVGAGDMSEYYNLQCAEGVSGQVMITIDGPVSYVEPSANAMAPTINGMTFTYDIADFGEVNMSTDFGLILATDTTAQSEDLICVSVLVTPIEGDNVASNNEHDFCYQVVNSYDPNDKLVYPGTVTAGYDDFLTYTINFQNTGSAPAFNIRLEDELSDLVDLTTFEPIGHSHDMNFVLVENDLKIYFPNIMLPDSTTDEAASHGYFQYRIKPLSDLPAGTEIENTAHIFFDFNEAIITNTAVTIFEDIIIGVNDVTLDSDISLFPNPAVDQFYIRTAKGMKILDISIVDQVGRTVDFTESHEESLLGVQLMDAKAGVYIVTMSTETGVVQERLVLTSARN